MSIIPLQCTCGALIAVCNADAERTPHTCGEAKAGKVAYALQWKKSPYWVGFWNDRSVAEGMQAKLAARGDAATIVTMHYTEPPS